MIGRQHKNPSSLYQPPTDINECADGSGGVWLQPDLVQVWVLIQVWLQPDLYQQWWQLCLLMWFWLATECWQPYVWWWENSKWCTPWKCGEEGVVKVWIEYRRKRKNEKRLKQRKKKEKNRRWVWGVWKGRRNKVCKLFKIWYILNQKKQKQGRDENTQDYPNRLQEDYLTMEQCMVEKKDRKTTLVLTSAIIYIQQM